MLQCNCPLGVTGLWKPNLIKGENRSQLTTAYVTHHFDYRRTEEERKIKISKIQGREPQNSSISSPPSISSMFWFYIYKKFTIVLISLITKHLQYSWKRNFRCQKKEKQNDPTIFFKKRTELRGNKYSSSHKNIPCTYFLFSPCVIKWQVIKYLWTLHEIPPFSGLNVPVGSS